MSSGLSKDFVEPRIITHPSPPDSWGLQPTVHYYLLDLQMCHLTSVYYNFEWGRNGKDELEVLQDRFVVSEPQRIVAINLSLNELRTLDKASLQPFTQLRSLDVSHNHLQGISGLSSCPKLRVITVSHNMLTSLDGLERNPHLIEINASANQIETISLLPILSHLTVLQLRDNRLKSLKGVKALSSLRELHVERNLLTDIWPVSCCLNLVLLNAGDNKLTDLNAAAEAVSRLFRLHTLVLKGNPIDREKTYVQDILHATQILHLDHESVRPEGSTKPNGIEQPYPRGPLAIFPRDFDHSLGQHSDLKEAARHVFLRQIYDHRHNTDDKVLQLQDQIRALRAEHNRVEDKLMRDMEQCVRSLDDVPSDSLARYNTDFLHRALPSPGNDPFWKQKDQLNKFKPSRDTDEVLRLACHKLARKQTLYNSGR